MGLTKAFRRFSRAGRKYLAEANPLGLGGGMGSGDSEKQPNVLASVPANATSKPPPDVASEGLLQGDALLLNKDSVRTVHGFTTKINQEKQMKHIPGSPYFVPGRSIFLGTVEDAQSLINEFAGTGNWIAPNRERIRFSKTIGEYINYLNGELTTTNMGIIHYSQSGAHIVPANPKGDRK